MHAAAGPVPAFNPPPPTPGQVRRAMADCARTLFDHFAMTLIDHFAVTLPVTLIDHFAVPLFDQVRRAMAACARTLFDHFDFLTTSP